MQQRHFSREDILSFDKRYRAAFVNSLGGFKSVSLVGTKNGHEQTNLAIFSSIVHIGSDPPLIGFVVRPDSVERHTYENILETSFYTLNHIHNRIVENAHQTAARYPRETSEFRAAYLTEEYKDGFFAPYVKESRIQLGVEFREKIDFTINGTIFLIGEIRHVYFPEEQLQEDGFLDIEGAQTVSCSGLDSYHLSRRLSRLNYPKPDKWPEEVGRGEE